MSNPVSVLQAIKQEESELRRRVEDARRDAAARIQAARAEAEQSVAHADEAGRVEAEAFYQGAITEARQQAEVLIAGAQEEAAGLRARAAPRLNDVAKEIVEIVLSS
jgi:F-type H+-transporting ATPase subunit b